MREVSEAQLPAAVSGRHVCAASRRVGMGGVAFLADNKRRFKNSFVITSQPYI